MHEQNKNNIKEAENIKRNQTEMLELENTITKSKNWLQGFEIRLIKEKKRISNFEDRSSEIIQAEEQNF